MCSIVPAINQHLAAAPYGTVTVAHQPTVVVQPPPNKVIDGANHATYVTNSVPGSTAALNPAVTVVAAPACAATYTQLW